MNKGRIAARSRNMNLLLFAVAFCVMAVVMAAVFSHVTRKISSEFAERHAVSSAEALSAHIAKETGLMSKAAHSGAVIEWLADEYNARKKRLAYEEMAEIVGELYSFNLYIGVDRSLHEYKIETGDAADIGNENIFRPFTMLDERNPMDAWYFKCVRSPNAYLLGVDIDHVMQRKRVWLDYKVVRDGATLGILCTGLEFSHVMLELFVHDARDNMRSLIIDENGMIHMDSSLMSDKNFLYNKSENPIDKTFSDPALLTTVKTYLSGVEGYAQDIGDPRPVKLSSGPYQYMTIVPIRFTNWSVIVLAGNTAWFNMSYFIPICVTMLLLLIAFALGTNAINNRLIFQPLGKLDDSLELMRENGSEFIYGIERDDELGHLSKTIQDLFTKANVDALTGIYNRRYMEDHLERIIKFLSRSNGLLSVFMVDIDYFKKYNDTYGHDQGDVCLKAVAQSLAGVVVRTSDFAARYGGEEFVVVLPHADEAGARVIAEKLLENIRALNIPHANSDVAPHVTVSVGVATGRVEHNPHEQNKHSWEEYVKRADAALYMSKQSGRNRYTYLDF